MKMRALLLLCVLLAGGRASADDYPSRSIRLVVPFAAGTPKPAIEKLNAATNRALQSAEIVEQFRKQGYEPLGGTPQEMNALIEADVSRWTRIIRDTGVQRQ